MGFWGRSPRETARALYDLDANEQLRRDIAGALTRRVAPNAGRTGGITMRGKAGKHLNLAGETLVVRAEPGVVADLVTAAVLGAKAKFAPSAELEAGEVVAWESESIFGTFPRFVVRSSPLLPGAAEVGATRIKVSMRMPQGGPFVHRGVTAAAGALGEQGVAFSQWTRQFHPGPDVQGDGDGVWYVGEIVTEATLPA